jgi:hypothetical protein
MGANVRKKELPWDNRLFDPSSSRRTDLIASPATNDTPVDEATDEATDEAPGIGFRATLKADAATFEPGPPKLTKEAAVQQGYTGDQCNNCFSMRMQVAGHCMVCADCGTTTGCS